MRKRPRNERCPIRHQPLANRVFVDPIQDSKVTKSGLVIPDTVTRNKHVAYGTVVAVGPGRHLVGGELLPCAVKVGDVVCFPRNAPAVLPLIDAEGNETLQLMMPDNDIISIVHDLPRSTGLVDISGAMLAINPQSLALPDSAYRNREELDRSISDLKQGGAPPDIIRELEREQVDQDEGAIDMIES